jgi:hypothetical protein
MNEKRENGEAEGDPADATNTFRAPRKNLLLSAVLRSQGVTAPVRIRNLSEKGAMIDGNALPEPGATVMLERLEVEMRGVIVWRTGGHCGISFDGAISVNEWVNGRRAPATVFGQGQRRVDNIQAAIRSGGHVAEEIRR